MCSSEDKVEDLDAITEIAAAIKRAGLQPTKEQIVNLVPMHALLQQRLKKIRQELDPSIQPAIIFPTATKSDFQGSKNVE